MLSLVAARAAAQDYHAIQGSPYAGSLGTANNPASIVTAPYPWDITVLAAQMKITTNVLTVHNYAYLSSPDIVRFSVDKGNYSRYAIHNFNVNLLNARIAIDRRHAVAFGINLRGYSYIKTGRYHYEDTLRTLKDFFIINGPSPVFGADLVSSSWGEIFGTYSQTVIDNETGRLNLGITLKVMRGISGAHVQLLNAGVTRDGNNNYTVAEGSLQYGYSANYDLWTKHRTTVQNLNDFIAHSSGAYAMDIGMEYLIKGQEVTGIYDDNYYGYDWKIGVSLLDIGKNLYRYGRESRVAAGVKKDITPEILEQRFDTVKNLAGFNHSLAGVANQVWALRGTFGILNPTRLVINTDKHLNGDFYLNGELSVNLSSLPGISRLYVREMNLVTLVPRWETRTWGIYLPIQYNVEKQFWVGAAAKAGPLLLGVHNLAAVFAGDRLQKGGFYMALVIRPSGTTRRKTDKRLDCP